MLRTPRAKWSREAWQRAIAARQIVLASAITGDERLAQSAARLNRSYEQLRRSEPRVGRGRRRR